MSWILCSAFIDPKVEIASTSSFCCCTAVGRLSSPRASRSRKHVCSLSYLSIFRSGATVTATVTFFFGPLSTGLSFRCFSDTHHMKHTPLCFVALLEDAGDRKSSNMKHFHKRDLGRGLLRLCRCISSQLVSFLFGLMHDFKHHNPSFSIKGSYRFLACWPALTNNPLFALLGPL